MWQIYKKLAEVCSFCQFFLVIDYFFCHQRPREPPELPRVVPLLPRVEPLDEVPEVVDEVERWGAVVVVAERWVVVVRWGTADVGCVERVVLLPRCEPPKVWGRVLVVAGVPTFWLVVVPVSTPERVVPCDVADLASPMW